MSQFVDQMLVQLSDPAQFVQLLTPAADANHTRLLTLVGAVYDQPFATVHDARDPQVVSTELQYPLFPPGRLQGTWTQTIPSYTRTDIAYERLDWLQPVWVDLAVQAQVTLVLEVDTGQVQSILLRDIDDFTSLDDFRARFQFFDVDRFLADEGITTVDQLRDRHDYLVAQITLSPPPPFDPNAAVNQHRYPLSIAVLIRDSIDLAVALRDAKLARLAAERALAVRPRVDTADVVTPYAPLVVFPQAALNGTTYTADSLQSFFASEHILALVASPS